MALPTSMQLWKDWTRHGISVAVFPSTQARLGVELQSSTASSLASSQWQSVYMPPSTGGGQLLHTYDTLPMSTRRYYFRARHVGPGVQASSWTPTVSAMPTTLSVIVPIPLVNAAGNLEVAGGDILISSANKPKVGSQNTSSFITKTQRFSMDLFNPAFSTKHYARGVGTLVIGTTGSSNRFNATYPIPKGVTVTRFAYTGRRRGTTAQVSKMELYRISTAGIATLVTTLTMTTGSTVSNVTITSSALSVAVSTAQNIIAVAYLKATSVSNVPSMAYSDITYTMPDYTKAI